MSRTSKRERLDLQWQILIGIVCGIAFGIFLNRASPDDVSDGPLFVLLMVFKYGGEIFKY